jgi:hypothetical protein
MKDYEKRPFTKDLLSHNFINNVPGDPRSVSPRGMKKRGKEMPKLLPQSHPLFKAVMVQYTYSRRAAHACTI